MSAPCPICHQPIEKLERLRTALSKRERKGLATAYHVLRWHLTWSSDSATTTKKCWCGKLFTSPMYTDISKHDIADLISLRDHFRECGGLVEHMVSESVCGTLQ